VTASFRSGRYLRTRIFRRHCGGRREEMRCTSKTRTKWIEQSVFRVPIATMEMERVTRFGDLLSVGATRCIFTGVSPGESVYVTTDHGGVEVYSVDLKLP